MHDWNIFITPKKGIYLLQVGITWSTSHPSFRAALSPKSICNNWQQCSLPHTAEIFMNYPLTFNLSGNLAECIEGKYYHYFKAEVYFAAVQLYYLIISCIQWPLILLLINSIFMWKMYLLWWSGTIFLVLFLPVHFVSFWTGTNIFHINNFLIAYLSVLVWCHMSIQFFKWNRRFMFRPQDLFLLV